MHTGAWCPFKIREVYINLVVYRVPNWSWSLTEFDQFFGEVTTLGNFTNGSLQNVFYNVVLIALDVVFQLVFSASCLGNHIICNLKILTFQIMEALPIT